MNIDVTPRGPLDDPLGDIDERQMLIDKIEELFRALRGAEQTLNQAAADIQADIESGWIPRAGTTEITARRIRLKLERQADAARAVLLNTGTDHLVEALQKIANQSAQDYEDPEQEAYASREIAALALAKAGL